MRITDLLDAKSISLNLSPKSKSEALDMAVDLMVKSGKINDREGYRKQVYLREEEGTTGIGEGMAIPHGKCDAVDRPGLAAMVIKDGVVRRPRRTDAATTARNRIVKSISYLRYAL